MNPLVSSVVGAIVRALLVSLGATGMVDDDQVNQIVGAVSTAIGIGWSVYQKWRTHKTIQTAAATGEVP